MTIYEIGNHPSQEYSIIVNESVVVIHPKWNANGSNGGYWTLSITTAEGEVISSGRRIKSGYPIFPPNANGFYGTFFAYPLTVPEEELGIEPWNATHKLMFFGEDDYEQYLTELATEEADGLLG